MLAGIKILIIVNKGQVPQFKILKTVKILESIYLIKAKKSKWFARSVYNW